MTIAGVFHIPCIELVASCITRPIFCTVLSERMILPGREREVILLLKQLQTKARSSSKADFLGAQTFRVADNSQKYIVIS